MLQRIKNAVSKPSRIRFIKDVSIVLSGNVISRFINMISGTILIPAALSAHDFGVFSNLIVITSIMVDFSGLSAAVMRYTTLYKAEDRPDKIGKLISTTLINILVATVIFVGFTIFASSQIAHTIFPHDQNLPPDLNLLIVISTCGLITTLTFNNIDSVLHGLQDFKGLTIYKIAFSIERFIPIAIMFATKTISVTSLVYFYTVTPLIPLLIGFYLILRKHKIKIPLSYDFAIVKETFNFSKWLTLSATISIIQSSLDQLLLSALRDATQSGYLRMANLFVNIFGTATGSFDRVIGPKLISTQNFDDLKRVMTQVSKVFLGILGLLLLALIVLPLSIYLIFGNKYQESILPLIIMLGSQAFYIWTYPLSGYFNSRGKSVVYFVSTTIQVAVNLFSSFMLIPRFGAVGAAISYAIVNATGLLIMIIFFTYFFRKEQKEHEQA